MLTMERESTKPTSAVDVALKSTDGGTPHESGAVVHTGPTAAAAASELGASAFTAGNNVFFGAGNDPSTAGGALMQHELAHVEQTKGLAAPAPGNYQVSDPHGAAELGAQHAEHGGDAGGGGASHTIYRSLLGDIGSKIVDATMKATGADKLEDFLNALAAHDVPGATGKWALVNGAMRGTIRLSSALMNVVSHYPGGLKADPLQSVIEIMGKDGLPILKDTGAAFSSVTYVDQILDGSGHDGAYWLPALKGAGVFDAWLTKMPNHAALTDARMHKLAPFMAAATDAGDARKIFQQAFPKLLDAPYNAGILKSAPWGLDEIKRMWAGLEPRLPLAHILTISGGFNLGTDENLDGSGFKSLGFGWHHPGPNVIVMPKVSSGADGGGTGHDMSGGDASGVAVAGTKDDPKVTHWDGTVLHEVGHGVGAATDGNDYAKTHGDWKGSQPIDAWSKALFDDAAATAALPTPPPKDMVSAADARAFLAAEVAAPGAAALPAAAVKGGMSRADVETFINAHYAAQPLVGYWKKRKGGTAEYMADASNFAGGRTYVWLSRGGLGYTSYKKEITDSKVSWYSISSTVEWFAEQYTNYYRTNKTACSDSTTKAKMDTIDKMDAASGGGLSAKASPGGGAGGGAGGDGKGAAGGNKAAAGTDYTKQVHRMNF